MITKLSHILAICSVGCLSLLAQNSFAQEDAYPPYNFQEPSYQELNLNDDKALIYEHNENRSPRTIQSIQRDSAINASKAKTAKKVSTEKKDDDALSFNFLYYIIQKYKISDIVDQ